VRVKFGNHIDECSRVRHSDNSNLLLITTGNSVYAVNCGTKETAAELLQKVLTDGYIDVSHLQYSN